MAFAYSTNIQNRIALSLFGVQYSTLTTPQRIHLDGDWTTGSLTTGAAFDAFTRVTQIATWFEMAGASSAPQVWEHWFVWETCYLLSSTYRQDRANFIKDQRETSIDDALDSFTLRDPTGSFASSNSSQAITVQGIRYFCLNHGARRKEAGRETGMRRRMFFPIDEIDSHLQWVLNFLYNKEHWSFRKRAVQLRIKYLSTLTAGVWVESTKSLGQTGAFTDLHLTNGPAMILITGGTGVLTGEYQIASRVSDDEVTLTSSLSDDNIVLAHNDITGVLFYLDIRGMLANETIDAVASRRFYYQSGSGQIGSTAKLNWVDATQMDQLKAYNALGQGQPGAFRIENQPSGVKSWRFAPFPDADYVLNGSVFVSGPGTPSSVSDTTVFDKFPVEFGTIIRDMVLARLLQANNASDSNTFWSRAIDQVQTLLPQFVDQGNATKQMGPEDVYGDAGNLIGGNLIWGGSGAFGGGAFGLT